MRLYLVPFSEVLLLHEVVWMLDVVRLTRNYNPIKCTSDIVQRFITTPQQCCLVDLVTYRQAVQLGASHQVLTQNWSNHQC